MVSSIPSRRRFAAAFSLLDSISAATVPALSNADSRDSMANTAFRAAHAHSRWVGGILESASRMKCTMHRRYLAFGGMELTVEASPAKAKQVRRFANYYLPDAVNVLEQYAKLARQGVRGENAASIRAEVERNAASIATAFENQLDALYAAESMDLSADLTVLQNMLKGQGLG